MRQTIIAATLAYAVTAIVFAPAAVAADTSANGIAVAYGDLDLGTKAGQAELKSRLQDAATTLCSPILSWPVDAEPTIHEHQILYRACIGRLADRAMAKVKADHTAS